MLQEFYVDNFKSLVHVTFRPHPQNLLLGLNNSGKTNLCQALTFLRGTASIKLDDCADLVAGLRVGLRNHYLNKPSIDFTAKVRLDHDGDDLAFEYRLSVVQAKPLEPARPVATDVPSLEVESETLSVTGGGFDGADLIQNTRDSVKLLNEAEFLKENVRYAETSAPRDSTMLQRLYDLKTNPRANQFKRYLSSWNYYALSPLAMRGFVHSPNQVVLNWNGGNLASVLYQLKTTNERQYQKFLTFARKLDSRIQYLNFQAPSESSIFMFLEESGGNTVPAWTASDGTLRWLALVYVLLIQPTFVRHSVVMVEEPENGIYVGFFKDLLQLIAESESNPIIVFTSHSPYFIDLFDEKVDSVFVMQRGEQHSTLTQPDVQKVRSRLDTYPLGEQHFREMLA